MTDTAPKKNRFVFVRCDHLADPGFDMGITVYEIRKDGGFPHPVGMNTRILRESTYGGKSEAVQIAGKRLGLKHNDYAFASPDDLMMEL